MYRWTARFALLIMLVPIFGPLAVATVAPQQKMQCCVRRPMATARAPVAETEMPCHHRAFVSPAQAAAAKAADAGSHSESGAAANAASQASTQPSTLNAASPEASFHSLDCCGQRCDCCNSSKTSEWARLVSNRVSFDSRRVEPATGESAADYVSSPLLDADSARAPPSSSI
jgi:hypothetical protein